MSPRIRRGAEPLQREQSLDDVGRDATVRVVRVSGGRRLVHRLAALGVVPGAELRVVRPRSPALVSIGGGRVAIGRNAARNVVVEEVVE